LLHSTPTQTVATSLAYLSPLMGYDGEGSKFQCSNVIQPTADQHAKQGQKQCP